MARRVELVLAGISLALMAGSPAYAQKGDSGSIVGYVIDQTGSPIRGVKVTASAPTQIGGKKVVYTNDEGFFRFPILEPGTFQVRTEAPKLKTQVQENVKVGINAPAELNIVLEVASDRIEEVKVVEKAPLVSTTTANVKEVYDIDFVDSMPHDNRDVIYSQITNYSAGTIRGGRIRGGGGSQTLYEMDGFNMLRQYPTLKASAAYEIQTAAYGPDHANAPGGVVNLVTRSGSNKFELELNTTVDDNRLRFFQDSLDSRAGGHFYILNPTVSGPIIKDRLWYSANVEFLTQKTSRDGDAEGRLPEPLPELRNWFKGTVKLTWQVSSRNKLQSVTNFDEWWQFNRSGGLGYDHDSQSTGRSRKYFSGLIFESVLTDAVVFRSQAGIISLNNRFNPASCQKNPIDCDNFPGTVDIYPPGQNLNNATSHDANDVYSGQFINRLEIFSNSKALGEHDIQLKNNVIWQQEINRHSVPGDFIYETNRGVPSALTEYWADDPRFDSPRKGWFITTTTSVRNVASLQDAWKPTRHLTITPGVGFSTATANNSRGDTVLTQNALTPSIAAAWDATHDGRTVLRGSFNQYVDLDLNPVATHSLGSQVQRKCKYNDANGLYDKECVYSGGISGATIGRPCGPSGISETGEDCTTGLKIPKTWEYTLGAEREITEGLSLSFDFIYRLFANQYEKTETNRIWTPSGTLLDPGGGYRNGRQQTVSDLETPDNARRRYVGLTAALTRREGKMKVHAAYTWSRLDGTVLEGLNNRLGDIGPRDVFLDGPLADDHRHELKVNLSYMIARWLSTSVRYSYYSGLPYNRLFQNSVTGSFEDYRAVTGINPGTNLNDPGDDRPLRLPDFHSLNAQFVFNLQPLLGARVETFVDVLNILNQRTTKGVSENDNADFGVQRDREPPMRARFGARYRY
jgi:hypothetical protein